MYLRITSFAVELILLTDDGGAAATAAEEEEEEEELIMVLGSFLKTEENLESEKAEDL